MDSVNQFVELLQAQTNKNPDRIAYTFLLDGESKELHWTNEDLHIRACMIAAAIQDLGIAKNERALLLYEPSLDYIAAFFGCLYAGIIAVPAYLPYNAETATRIQYVINSAQPKLCLTTKKIRLLLRKMDVFNWLGHQPIINKVTHKFAKSKLDHAAELAKCNWEHLEWLVTDGLSLRLAKDWKQIPITGEQIAFLQYTSGSTGHPKGVMVSHRNLLHNLNVLQIAAGLSESKQVAAWLPPYHDMGLIGVILLTIYYGGTARLMSPVAFLQRPVRWLQAISKYRAHSSAAPNFAYELCVAKVTEEEAQRLDLSCWKTTAIGAEPIRANTLKRFVEKFAPYGFKKQTLFPCYGLAESTLIVSGAPTIIERDIHLKAISKTALQNNQVILSDEKNTQSHIMVSSGSAMRDLSVIIVDPDKLTLCTENQIGEIWISGASVAKGYWQEPELTEQVFNAKLNTGEGPYLRTGDLGFFNTNELYVTGRLKDLIIIHGVNHYPHDIELTVEKCHHSLRPGCTAAFAIEQDDQEKLVIVQEIKTNDSHNYKNITTTIRNQVFKHHGINPFAVVLIKPKTLPKTTSGKIRRKTCQQYYLNNQLQLLFIDQKDHNEQVSLSVEKVKAEKETREVLSMQNLIHQLSRITQQSSNDIKPDSRLSMLGVNSLSLVELQYSIEKKFQTSISMEFLLDDPTVKALYSLLTTHEPQQGVTFKQKIDWHDEFEKCKYQINFNTDSSPSIRPQKILLTGATGFLGAYLLKELLEQTSYVVYCVVKMADESSKIHKIQNNLKTYHLWQEQYAARIKCVPGDLTLPKLGLSDAIYDDLSNRIDLIYHNAAILNFVYPYSRLKPANVLGTREILMFASARKIKPVHYISTVGYFLSADLPANSEVNEAFDLSPHHGIYGGYNQSKWLAEKVVKGANLRGLPATIYRPGLIAGDSTTGQINTNDFISRMLKGFMQLRASPELDTELDLVPVDFVAKAIVHLSIQTDSIGETYHLVNPKPTHFRQMMDYLNKCRKVKIKSLSYEEWQKKLTTECEQDKNNPLYPLLPFFIEKVPNKNYSMFELYTKHDRPSISCNNTFKKLKESQISCTAIDEYLVKKYLHQLDCYDEYQNTYND